MIWLVGNAGMLGQEVEKLLRQRGLPYVASDREVDITAAAVVEEFVAANRPRWVINCAAYTAVDRAEEEPETAWRLNALGPENLARACAGHGAHLAHVSTDYVFDGTAADPYGEDSPPNPVGVYGTTKAEGERRVASVLDEHIICRTAWLFGPGGGNFVATMLRLFAERPEISVVADEHGRPTYAPDLAGALIDLVEAGAPFGIYHFANSGATTWFEFAREIQVRAAQRNLVPATCRVVPTTAAAYGLRAHRPANSVLATGRIEQFLGRAPRPWWDALSDYFESIAAGQCAC